MTLVKVKVKVTIEGHKGEILGQISDLTYFNTWHFGKLWSLKLKVTVNRRECLSEHFDTKLLHIYKVQVSQICVFLAWTHF